jgi:hypothetical protein
MHKTRKEEECEISRFRAPAIAAPAIAAPAIAAPAIAARDERIRRTPLMNCAGLTAMRRDV